MGDTEMPERLYAVKTFDVTYNRVEFIADEEQLAGDTEYIRADVVRRMIATAQPVGASGAETAPPRPERKD